MRLTLGDGRKAAKQAGVPGGQGALEVRLEGLEFGGLIAFSVVTETIFAWPGMGKLIIDSINVLDRPVIVAYLMMVVLLFITANLIVDILYTVLDPRVRLEGRR